ncbi:MAG: hypothetical protein FD145_199 [Candidatus Saganbacteria bacterium]|uniref:Prepilin-type N-terminal cleavage/methylation domain-containing protein n=1 Tax=Candidatus Saganbacteria bacterium TaxID=2575572 RepID=A0A833NXJ7_UNCSA|nr:MAG: hypothetical protein FD145_199 [Candidatus Saganbacteria bacterium]
MNKKGLACRQAGFTLVELLVSLAIASTILLFGAPLMLNYSKNISLLNKKTAKLETEQSVLRQMAKEIRSADSLIKFSSREVVIKIDNTAIAYDYFDKKARRKKNNYSQYLTDNGEIDSISFIMPKNNFLVINLDSFETGVCLRNEK